MVKLIVLSFTFLICSCSTVRVSEKRKPSSIDSSILHIGDSQTASHFGRRIYNTYKKNFSEAHVYGVRGTSFHHWNYNSNKLICGKKKNGRIDDKSKMNLKSTVCRDNNLSSLEEVLLKHKPNFVVFQFLGNFIYRKSAAVKDFRKSLSALESNQECIYIVSPPSYKDIKDKKGNLKNTVRFKYADILKEEARDNGCAVIGGTDYVNNTMKKNESFYYLKNKKGRRVLGDGVHITDEGAEFFNNYVRDELAKLFK